MSPDESGNPIHQAQTYPHCGAELTFESVYRTFFQNISHTAAITSANKFISFDLAIIPFLLINLLVIFMDFPVWIRAINLAFYAGNIVLIKQWFRRYWYHFRWEDTEYLESLTQMKRTLAIWVAAQRIVWCELLAEILL